MKPVRTLPAMALLTLTVGSFGFADQKGQANSKTLGEAQEEISSLLAATAEKSPSGKTPNPASFWCQGTVQALGKRNIIPLTKITLDLGRNHDRTGLLYSMIDDDGVKVIVSTGKVGSRQILQISVEWFKKIKARRPDNSEEIRDWGVRTVLGQGTVDGGVLLGEANQNLGDDVWEIDVECGPKI